MYFDILNRLGTDHQYNRQTDEQRDRQNYDSNSVFLTICIKNAKTAINVKSHCEFMLTVLPAPQPRPTLRWWLENTTKNRCPVVLRGTLSLSCVGE